MSRQSTSRRIVLPPLNRITKDVILNRLNEVCPSLLTEEDPITLQSLKEMDYDKLKTIQLYINPLNKQVCYFTKAYLDHLKKDFHDDLWNNYEQLLNYKKNYYKYINSQLLLKETNKLLEEFYNEMPLKMLIKYYLYFENHVFIHDTTKLYIPRDDNTNIITRIITYNELPYELRIKYPTSLPEAIKEIKPIQHTTLFEYLNELTYSLMEEDDILWKEKLETYKNKYPNACSSLGGSGTRKRFNKMTVKELQERCKKRKLKYNGLRKAELIALLRRK